MRLITTPLFYLIAYTLITFGALIGILLGIFAAFIVLVEDLLLAVWNSLKLFLGVVHAWCQFGWDTAELIFKRPGRTYEGWGF